MTDSFSTVDLILNAAAQAIVENEKYFCELDSVAGDGDFGFSLARGFEKVLADYDALDRKDMGIFLKQIGMLLANNCGGATGPIWGAGFMRAGAAIGAKTDIGKEDVVIMLRASVEGIQARGKAQLGDKTLLDALVPFTESFAEAIKVMAPKEALVKAAGQAQIAAEKTSMLIAKRGRASYKEERGVGSPDAGAIAVALLVKKVAQALNA